ncbi:MAG: CocE/NonD family hydrolase [Cyanobacteria bacterium K_Offshore_0m_m2_072]|nr:CocE/NonD family hydrolase [Cyanobacteria bacterium K_Offshore_0m_m2_072]
MSPEPQASPTIQFVPKTPAERQALLQQADADAAVAAVEEQRLRREWLPVREYPFAGPISYPDIVVETVMVPMRDGACLRSDVYRPAGDGRYPVLLLRGPYDMNSTLDSAPGLLRNLARRGYVGIAQSVRGRFGSEGHFEAAVHEHDDSFDAVEWAAQQSWSNGRVAMTGISYLGFTSYSAAVSKPKGLVAIMPSCIKYGMEQTCGAPPLTAMAAWFIWAGQPTTTLQNFRRIDWLHLPLNQIDDEAGLSHPNFKLMVEERYSDLHATLPAPEIERRLTSIEVPTRVVCGWYDEIISVNLTNYERQAQGGGDVSLVVGPWHHNLEDILEARIGQLPVPEVYINRYYLEMERFLEHYLKAGATTPLEAPGPVLLYVMGSNVWRYEQEWPLSRAVTTPLYLSSGGRANTDRGDGELLWQPPAGEQQADSYAYNPLDPVRSVEGLGVWNLFTVGQMGDRAAIESRDDVLVYSSAPLAHDLEVTGTIEATLHAASSAVDTDFIINLIDVHPDGFTQYITQALVRASYREGLGERKLIEPGKVYDYRLSFRPTSICFLKGHRIRIEVTSSDMDRHARNQNVADAPGTTANVAIAQQTIHHSGLMCSRLDLPVIPAG